MYIGIMAFNGHATKLPPTAAANAAAGIAFSSCARSVSGSDVWLLRRFGGPRARLRARLPWPFPGPTLRARKETQDWQQTQDAVAPPGCPAGAASLGWLTRAAVRIPRSGRPRRVAAGRALGLCNPPCKRANTSKPADLQAELHNSYYRAQVMERPSAIGFRLPIDER